MVDCVDTVNVEAPLPPAETVTLLGFTETVGPLGEMVGERVIVPAKAPMLVSVIVEALDAPVATENDDGLDEILKSGVAGWVTVRLWDAAAVALAESWTVSCALKVPVVE